MALRDKLLKSSPLPRKEIELRGEKVRIRGLSTGENLDIVGRVGREDFRLSDSVVDMLIWCVEDPHTGKPVFTEDDRAEILDMNPLDSEDLLRISSEIRELSGNNEEVAAMEEAKKNSNPTPSSEST